MIATARVGAYLADRGRDAGRRAFGALDEAELVLKRDLRPLKLRLQLATRIGAWGEARTIVKTMLELEPGDLALEARYRSLQAMPQDAPDVDLALIHVERTGALSDGDAETGESVAVPVGEVRPLLQKMAGRDNVDAAVYVRGSTALVQGLRGAQAERIARAMRGVLQSGRAAARSLGLGQISGVEMEGGFGQLFLAAGEMDAGALWCRTSVRAGEKAELMNLLGVSSPGTPGVPGQVSA
jgi:predicted regulator of Ras-like GTPase activity (Roadblock/LC7/MglB family)